MSAAREEILARVRRCLAADPELRTRSPSLPPVPAAEPVAPGEREQRFRAALERVGGHVERVGRLAAALERVRALAELRGLGRIALSDAPELAPLRADWSGVERCGPEAPRPALLAAELGVTCAQLGIAETGTLVLASAAERHRLISLLPPVHVALLPAARLVGTLGEALAALRTSTGAPASRTITLVTGPSRTADIELTLVVGVHGPRELHVLLHD